MTHSTAKPLLPGIHIILGDSAGSTFTRIYGTSDRLLIDQDVLSCGPTPKCADLREWGRVRREYWSLLAPDGEQHIPSPFNLDYNAQRLRDAEHIYIWAATSLTEQLFIAHVVHLADSVGADPARISLLQFVMLSGRRACVLGMGELNEENMSDHPEPVPLSNNALEDYRAAWSALTSDDPTGLERFATRRLTANVWLKNAMQLMLRRFPDARSGLTHWDMVLLRQVREHGPRAAKIIDYAMERAWDDSDLTGDSYLFGRLLRLGDERLPKPLVTLTGNRTRLRELGVALTPFGEEVLNGAESNYPANPIDDYAAGVRLSSAERKLWFNDGGRLVR